VDWFCPLGIEVIEFILVPTINSDVGFLELFLMLFSPLDQLRDLFFVPVVANFFDVLVRYF